MTGYKHCYLITRCLTVVGSNLIQITLLNHFMIIEILALETDLPEKSSNLFPVEDLLSFRAEKAQCSGNQTGRRN